MPAGKHFVKFALTVPSLMAFLLMAGPAFAVSDDDGQIPERVSFPSADGKTELLGYLYKPEPDAGRHPAVVLMHGRSGAYSSLAEGVYDATTLSARHKAWGRFWAEAGYVAILVDGFSSRGYPAGFPRYSYDERPAAVNEVTVRPLDAYGALAYLRKRADVISDRIGLMGWSNGASAAIVAMGKDAPGIKAPTPATGFRAALAFYPACKLRGIFDDKPFRPYAPVLILHGTADEEVSYERCVDLVEDSQAKGGEIDIELLRGATHDFDAPVESREEVEANRLAAGISFDMAADFFAKYLKDGNKSVH